jgi:S-methylmethionine-dependent homocysteine/selenocysteine methylase
MDLVLLDGPMGTQLIAHGVPAPMPFWSAWALAHAPQAVARLHREYAEAGATVHTSNTFRTRPAAFPNTWAERAVQAVALARDQVPDGHRVAGSIAPIADCYSPHLSPESPGPQHAALAEVLVQAGVDLLLCETFPHVGEALAAVQAAVATGVETWVAFTAGPDANLLTPDEIARGAEQAVELGAEAVLVNCIPASRTADFVRPLADLGVPFGAYANAGHTDDGIGWSPDPDGPQRYADLAAEWRAIGATIIGSCCGTGPAHIAALKQRLG